MNNNSLKLHLENKTRELQLTKLVFNKDVEFIKVKKDKGYIL